MNYRILLGLFVLGCGGGDFHPTDDTTSTDPASDSNTSIGIRTPESPDSANTTNPDNSSSPDDERSDFQNTVDSNPPDPDLDASTPNEPEPEPDTSPEPDASTDNTIELTEPKFTFEPPPDLSTLTHSGSSCEETRTFQQSLQRSTQKALGSFVRATFKDSLLENEEFVGTYSLCMSSGNIESKKCVVGKQGDGITDYCKLRYPGSFTCDFQTPYTEELTADILKNGQLIATIEDTERDHVLFYLQITFDETSYFCDDYGFSIDSSNDRISFSF